MTVLNDATRIGSAPARTLAPTSIAIRKNKIFTAANSPSAHASQLQKTAQWVCI
jgi:hypothetical protein